jgi:hypothetical protein
MGSSLIGGLLPDVDAADDIDLTKRFDDSSAGPAGLITAEAAAVLLHADRADMALMDST